jgi:hypothetical protein
MRTRRPRRTLAAITSAAVLLTGATAALLVHKQMHNGRRRDVAALPAASRPTRNPAIPPRASSAEFVDLAGLRWVDFHGIRLPVTAQDGPREMRGGLASGFTDTPAGALLAAINIGVRTAAQWGPPVYQPTITHQVVGPDTAALLTAQAAAYQQLQATTHVASGQPAGRGYAVEAAYRLVTYNPSDTALDLVTAGPGSDGTTVLAVTRIEVTWRDGDWRVVAPPDGDWGNSATTITSLTGYTIFPGEG